MCAVETVTQMWRMRALNPYRRKELPCYVFRISARPIWCRLGPTEFEGGSVSAVGEEAGRVRFE